MNWRTTLIPLVMVLAAIGAGCTGTSPAPGTPAQTTGATVTQPATLPGTTPPAATEACIVPGPTVTIDPRFVVGVDVIRDPVTLNKKITVIFQGGKGQYLTQRVDATITRDDCSMETKSITRPESGGSIVAGSSVSFNGSDRDRVQVTVTINGVAYKIIDQVYAQQTRP
jgi:hypothetical protein